VKTLGQLKLEMMGRGVALSQELRQNELIASSILTDAGREEMAFLLSDDFFVRAPVVSGNEGGPSLHIEKERFLIQYASRDLEVGLIPPPQFLQPSDSSQKPAAATIRMDGYCLNLFLRADPNTEKLNVPETSIVTLIRSAFTEGVADLVKLNLEFCEKEDRCLHAMVPVMKQIKKSFRTFVALRGFLPDDLTTIDHMYAAGVDIMVFAFTGQDRAKEMRALEYSTGVFTHGSVFTEVAFNTQNPDAAKEQITVLAEKGVLPLLVLPEDGVPDPAAYERLDGVVRHLAATARQNKLNLKWLYPSARMVSPLDAPFFTEPPETAKLAMRPVYKSGLGKTASEGFAALRRKLRVKNISDSYESAGL